MAYCTFGVPEVRTITPNRFKNQSSGTLIILTCNCNHQQGLIKQKMSLCIIVVLRQNFLNLNTFIKIAILGKIYQYSSCYAKLEQHGSNVYVSTAALLSTFLIIKKSGLSISVHFYKNSLIVPGALSVDSKSEL